MPHLKFLPKAPKVVEPALLKFLYASIYIAKVFPLG